jgi:D-lactate dehydrogenase
MKIDFTETEQPEEDFFEAALAEHDLRFRAGLEVEANAEILCFYITSRIDAPFLESHPKLKLVTTRSAGHDHIDVSECSRRGVIVCEVPGSNANTVGRPYLRADARAITPHHRSARSKKENSLFL